MLARAEGAPGRTALDIGCGNGSLVRLASKDFAVIGMDVSAEVVVAARQFAGLSVFLRGAAEQLPMKDGSLDLIFAQHLIEHLPDPAAALTGWYRALRPGGRLIVLTPNARYPDPAIFDAPTHIRILEPHSARALLTAAGFRNLDIKTVFPYLLGHTVFGLRHMRLFARLPPWSGTGRSLLAVGEKAV